MSRRDWKALERLVGTAEADERRSSASRSSLSTRLWLASLVAIVTAIGVLAWLR